MSLDPGLAAVYTDFQGLDRLRLGAREQSPEVLREVAQQFEALFIQMMLKNMREANLGDELFGSDQTRHYEGMFDQQISLHLGRQGSLGLADLLVRQLGGGVTTPEASVPATPAPVVTPAPVAAPDARNAGFESPEAFIAALRPHAEKAADALGIAPEVLLAQAALETGWGSRMMTRADGAPAYNLFGIKADQRWSGESTRATTLEFEQGVAVRRQESFRAYGSYAESFADYVDFVRSAPRYQRALEHDGDARAYVEGLQQAGYATDPEYAAKILRIAGSERLSGLS